MNLTIIPRQGIGDVKFDMPIEEVVAILGEASNVEQMDNAADENTTVLQYDELGLTLFFEGENPVLASIDIANEDCTLFDEDIFDLEEAEVTELMKSHNYREADTEDEDWGERRLSFLDANIDFYFEDDYLMSINIGK
ncbi:MAG: hypothetical protein MJZ51_06740 [Bacteroidales bacterium]|nr:hypothetical protein [Bacteroidales bacterium]